MRGAVPPLSQYAFMAWCLVKAQGQLYLYFLPKTQAGEPIIFGCPRLLIQYIRNCPPNLKVVSINHNLRMPIAVVTTDPVNMEMYTDFREKEISDPLVSTRFSSSGRNTLEG
jgi:hypothetical protein